jgi:hypothetical protein
VQGYIALSPPYGGSTYAIASKLGGTKWNLLAFIGDLLQPIINELVYQGSRGLPSMLMLMPNTRLWGKDFVSTESSGVGGRGSRQQQQPNNSVGIAKYSPLAFIRRLLQPMSTSWCTRALGVCLNAYADA